MLICCECGKKAIASFRFDIDLPKFGFCRKHKKIVREKIFMSLFLGEATKFKYPKRSQSGNRKKI